MDTIAFLFAGQGAQYPGMGKSLYELGGRTADIFEMAESIRPGLMRDCFEGGTERLAQTDVTQPCVYTVNLAAAAALEERGVHPKAVAGFSLGEMAALTFSGVFAKPEGMRLVCLRGQLMQQAAQQKAGTMAAVLKLADGQVEELCREHRDMFPANYNCEGQLVVSGSADLMPEFCAAVKAAGGMARPVAVSGAFHSPFMQPAAEGFLAELRKTEMAAPRMPVYANVTARPYGEEVAETLAAQIQKPVHWSDTVREMQRAGIDTFIEVGPGKTLSAFVKRILPGARVLNVQDAETLQAALDALAGQ